MADINWGMLNQTSEFKPAPGGTGAGIVSGISTNSDMDYKAALTKQAQSANQLQSIQATVAKAGLINDIIGATNDETSYQRALKNLKSFGIDTNDAPQSYDPSYVAQKQALSGHYLDVVKAKADIALKEATLGISAAQANSTAIKSNMPAPFPNPIQPSAGINLPGYGAANPGPMGVQQQAGGAPTQPMMPANAPMQAPSAPQAPVQAPGPTQAPMQANEPTQPASVPVGQPVQGQQTFAGSLQFEEKKGEQWAKSLDDFKNSLVSQADAAERLEADSAIARDANNKGIPTGKYTGLLRETFTPGAAQLMEKAGNDMLRGLIASLKGTGNRVMAGELVAFMKSLPGNYTQKETNDKIIKLIDLNKTKSQLDLQAAQMLEQGGYTNPVQMKNIMSQAYQMSHPVNLKNGDIRVDALQQNYLKNIQAISQNKELANSDSLYSPENLKATADKHGMTVDQLKKDLKNRGYYVGE
jgi:hypothetical protein